ncbi:hypothetical protein J4210_00080 [Candidatus Woesearchaeota archaeon]|nr:hypothetical protein [Candidatus Woesearchaeota archaeon]
MAKSLWEILVPNYSNDGTKYSLDHHHGWDAKIREIGAGLTILKPAKGQWLNSDAILFSEEMIPVRVYCDEESIDRIVQLTLDHYQQEAVLAYEVSRNVKLVYRRG